MPMRLSEFKPGESGTIVSIQGTGAITPAPDCHGRHTWHLADRQEIRPPGRSHGNSSAQLQPVHSQA